MIRIAAKAFSILCVTWTCSVPLYYVVTRDDVSITQWIRPVFVLGEPHASPAFAVEWLFLFSQFIAVPYGLLIALRAAWTTFGYPAARGALVGLSYGMWANTVFLVIPYVGAYPSIAGLGLASLMGKNTGLQHVPLLVGNVLVATLFGVLLALRRDQK